MLVEHGARGGQSWRISVQVCSISAQTCSTSAEFGRRRFNLRGRSWRTSVGISSVSVRSSSTSDELVGIEPNWSESARSWSTTPWCCRIHKFLLADFGQHFVSIGKIGSMSARICVTSAKLSRCRCNFAQCRPHLVKDASISAATLQISFFGFELRCTSAWPGSGNKRLLRVALANERRRNTPGEPLREKNKTGRTKMAVAQITQGGIRDGRRRLRL